MADSVVSFLLENLTQFLAQEATLLTGVEGQVKSLQAELKLMHGFLKDTEGKLIEHETLRVLVNQIRDVAYEAEDVIDEFITFEAKRRRGGRITGWKMNTFDRPAMLHDIGKRIENIQMEVDKIYQNKEKFGIEMNPRGDAATLEAASSSSNRRRRNIVEEIDVVGFEDDAKMIIERLIKADSERDVVSIVGMGGLGKTTLARKVYNEFSIKDYFKSRAWIFVSQEYRLRDLLLSILTQISRPTKEMYEMGDDELCDTVHGCLKGRRYLIVMDDVWKNEVWDELKRAFPDDYNGSKILLTSRVRDVAAYANPNSPPHMLRLLSEEESWELFLIKVFHKRTSCPLDLEAIGKQIVEKCGGLPLAIVVLAGLLSKKDKTHREWKRVAARVSAYVYPECTEILSMSYNNLPHHLKACFLYIGVFPEDFEIPMRRVIRLWIAEGLIQQDVLGLIEATAEDYLEDLVDRSLLQVASRRSDGGIKSCRVHDLLRDLCISEGKKEKLFQLDTSNPVDPRRLALHSSASRYIQSKPSAPHLRSFLCHSFIESYLSIQHWKFLYKNFKLLRVLDLGDVVVDSFPSAIEKLVLLRHLALNGPKIRSIPPSICKIFNLQTIEMRSSCIDRLPPGVWNMQQLRHLYFRGQTGLPEPAEIQMMNLQTLSTICPDDCLPSVMNKFPKLKKLGICGNLEACTDQGYTWGYKNGPHLKQLSQLESLERLKLVKDRWSRPLNHLPNWNEFPPNLIKLTLSELQLKSDPMPTLGKLPNLEILKITNEAFEGYEMSCLGGGFPNLRVLHLVKLRIGSCLVKDMPNLRRVVIRECGQLNIPHALKRISTLCELDLKWVNRFAIQSAIEIQNFKGIDKLKLQIYPPAQ